MSTLAIKSTSNYMFPDNNHDISLIAFLSEMIENVGHEFMDDFFGCCESVLAEDGLLVLQVMKVNCIFVSVIWYMIAMSVIVTFLSKF